MRKSSFLSHLALPSVTAASLWLACGVDIESLDNEEPCKSVGYSIAARTRICTGDEALAKQRYESFTSTYHCTTAFQDFPAEQGPFGCSIAVNAMECSQVDQCGDDLACWLAIDEQCARLILELADGGTDGAVPDGNAGGGGAAGYSGQSGAAGQSGAGGVGGSGGEPGSGGQAGTGGEPGWGGSAGTGGSAGSGGVAGPGGSAGTGGSAGAGPVMLASLDATPGDLAIDADNVYYTARGFGADAGKVFKVGKTSGGATPIATGLTCGAGGGPAGLALDDTDVYVAVEGCDSVVRIPKTGGAFQTIASYPTAVVTQVAAHDSQLFVALGSPPRVARVNKDGTGKADLVGLVAGSTVTAFAVGATELFFTVKGPGMNLQKTPFGSSAPTAFTAVHPFAAGLALDDTDVFFTNATASGSVSRVVQTGATAVAEFSGSEPTPSGIAVDAERVYWARRSSGEIVRRGKEPDAGAAEVIAGSQSEPGFVGLDDTHVFWTTQAVPWTVMRAGK